MKISLQRIKVLKQESYTGLMAFDANKWFSCYAIKRKKILKKSDKNQNLKLYTKVNLNERHLTDKSEEFGSIEKGIRY